MDFASIWLPNYDRWCHHKKKYKYSNYKVGQKPLNLAGHVNKYLTMNLQCIPIPFRTASNPKPTGRQIGRGTLSSAIAVRCPLIQISPLVYPAAVYLVVFFFFLVSCLFDSPSINPFHTFRNVMGAVLVGHSDFAADNWFSRLEGLCSKWTASYF